MSSLVVRGLARVRSLLPSRADLAVMGRDPRRDLLAGLTVAIVALPLALGFGVSSGLGAEAGLATAVVAGALAAVFGGSNLQVSGPTGAMTVVLVPIVARHGTGGVLMVGLIAGLMLLGLAVARAGRYMVYVPASVVEGFTVGIACVIGLQQVPGALGVAKPEGDKVLVVTWRAVEAFVKSPNWTAVALAAFRIPRQTLERRSPRHFDGRPSQLRRAQAIRRRDQRLDALRPPQPARSRRPDPARHRRGAARLRHLPADSSRRGSASRPPRTERLGRRQSRPLTIGRFARRRQQ